MLREDYFEKGRMKRRKSAFRVFLGVCLLGIAFILNACGENSSRKFELDQNAPENVLNAVFVVARGEAAPSLLASLCDPFSENDADTRRICDYGKGFDRDGEFAMFFESGKLNGEPSIDGNFAAIPFLYGPDGQNEDTMQLIRRDGKWYLYQF